jgi:hypothetical protein
VLGGIKPRTQRFGLGVADHHLPAKARDQVMILLAGAHVATFSVTISSTVGGSAG